MSQVSKSIDARGAFCPGPLMELIKAVKVAAVGEVIEVLSSEMQSVKDIPEWAGKMGHEVVYSEKEGDYWKVAVKKLK